MPLTDDDWNDLEYAADSIVADAEELRRLITARSLGDTNYSVRELLGSIEEQLDDAEDVVRRAEETKEEHAIATADTGEPTT